MIMLTTTASTTSARPSTNPWMASIYGGIVSGLIAAASGLLLGTNLPALYVLAFFLIGIGPVLGYQLAAGKLGQDWKSLIGGVIGFVLPVLSSIVLWPLLVWAFNRTLAFGKLWLGSLLGFILGIAVFLVVGMMIGQDPSWVGPGWALLWAFWGATSAAFMASAGRE